MDFDNKELNDEEKELFIKEYAEYLEIVKENNPEEYEKIVKQINEISKSDEFKAKLPGEKGYLGEDGIKKEEESLRIVPEPNFVIKTENVNTKEKIFINMCTHLEVQPIGRKVQLDEKGEEQEGINVPLSLGQCHKEKDKRGELSSTFDIIINPGVITEIKNDKTGSFKHFLVELSMNYVEQKYKIKLNPKYKLPKLKYRGVEIQAQRKVPVIEEVGSNEVKKTIKNNKSNSVSQVDPFSKLNEPIKYEMYPNFPDDIYEDDLPLPPPTIVYLSMQLLKNIPLNRIKVECSGYFLRITAAGHRSAEIPTNYCIRKDGTKIKYESTSGTLTCHLYVDKEYYSNISMKPDPGSQIHMMKKAFDSGEKYINNNKVNSTDVEQTSMDTIFNESDVLPEDKFHASDVLSSHYLKQKEMDIEHQKSKVPDPQPPEDLLNIPELPKIDPSVPLEIKNTIYDTLL